MASSTLSTIAVTTSLLAFLLSAQNVFAQFPCPSPLDFCDGECLPCGETDPVPGFEATLQYAILPDFSGIAFSANQPETDIAGIQADLSCKGIDKLSVTGGNGGSFGKSGFVISGSSIKSTFLAVTLSGGSSPPGFNLLTTLTVKEDLSKCEPDSLCLTNVVISSSKATTVSFCGSCDAPCPVPSPPPSVCGALEGTGDLNNDNVLNVQDAVSLVSLILVGNENLTDFQICVADGNNDLEIDVLDAVELVSSILGN